MTLFQDLILAAIKGILVFLPLPTPPHHLILTRVFGWDTADPLISASILLGCILVLLVYFKDDWASAIASGLRVVLTWHKPQSLDERMPFLILMTTLPTVLLSHFLPSIGNAFEGTLVHEFGTFGILGTLGSLILLLGIGLSWITGRSKSNRSLPNWSFLDAGLLGMLLPLSLVPGIDRGAWILLLCFFRNFHREASAKIYFFSLMVLLISDLFAISQAEHFSLIQQFKESSWDKPFLSFLLAFFMAWMVLGAFFKSLNSGTLFRGFLAYRIALIGLLIATGVFYGL